MSREDQKKRLLNKLASGIAYAGPALAIVAGAASFHAIGSDFASDSGYQIAQAEAEAEGEAEGMPECPEGEVFVPAEGEAEAEAEGEAEAEAEGECVPEGEAEGESEAEGEGEGEAESN